MCLRVEPGDSILLYGPNGAGKTTLLRVLSTLARPTEGTVLYAGADVLAHPAAAKSAMGFVSHTTFLYGELTARENLEFAGKLFGLADLPQRLAGVLDLFHLRERAETPEQYAERVHVDKTYCSLSIASAEAALKDKASKIVVDKGQNRQVSKNAKGVVKREVC